jgi:hypothetical protein
MNLCRNVNDSHHDKMDSLVNVIQYINALNQMVMVNNKIVIQDYLMS